MGLRNVDGDSKGEIDILRKKMWSVGHSPRPASWPTQVTKPTHRHTRVGRRGSGVSNPPASPQRSPPPPLPPLPTPQSPPPRARYTHALTHVLGVSGMAMAEPGCPPPPLPPPPPPRARPKAALDFLLDGNSVKTNAYLKAFAASPIVHHLQSDPNFDGMRKNRSLKKEVAEASAGPYTRPLIREASLYGVTLQLKHGLTKTSVPVTWPWEAAALAHIRKCIARLPPHPATDNHAQGAGLSFVVGTRTTIYCPPRRRHRHACLTPVP